MFQNEQKVKNIGEKHQSSRLSFDFGALADRNEQPGVCHHAENKREKKNEKNMMNAKQQQQYEIVGYSSKLFRDVTAAAYCHDEKQLHPHELDPYCTIDRFVRF